MGMDSLKIEGRLKTDYYLATVVRAYRKAIDDCLKLIENNEVDKYDYKEYLSELGKVKTRGLSEFYFIDENNQDIHDFDGQSENVGYEYAGKVVGNEEDLAIIEIKNKLSIGDDLDILYTDDLQLKEFKITELYDINNNEKIDTINPGRKGQLVKIKIPYLVNKGLIIRRKK
jgi:putative protease